MIIDRIRIENFKNLHNFEKNFDPGLTILKGPNEDGKSSLKTALHLAMFGDATTTKKEVLDQKTWSATALFKIEVGFRKNGEAYAIVRDFENKKNILTLPDGTTIKDKRKIEAKILELLGFPSEKSYVCSASITQDEIRKIESGASELRSLLEERVVGGGFVDLNDVVKGLEKYNNFLQKGGKNPGLLTGLNVQVTELRRKKEEVEQQVSNSQSSFIELKKVTEELDRSQKELDVKSKALENFKKYREQKKRYQEAETRFKEITDKANKRKKATEENRTLPEQIAQLQKELNDNETALKNNETYYVIDQEYGHKNAKLTELRNRIQRIESLTAQLNELDCKVKSRILIDEGDYETALSIPREIDSLEAGLKAQGIIVNISPKRRLSVGIVTDEKTEELQVLEKEISISARRRIQFSVEGIVEVEALSQTEGARAVVDEIKRKNEVWKSILNRYEVGNNDKLRKLMDEQKAIRDQQKEMSAQVRTLLGTDTIDELRAERDKWKEELEKILTQKDGLKEHALSELQTQEKRQKVRDLKQKIEELNARFHQNTGILREVEKEEILQQELEKSVKEMAISEENLQELQQFECSAEEFIRTQQETDVLKDRIGKLNTRKAVLEDRVSNSRTGSDDVAELTEKIQSCEEDESRHKRRIEVHDIILEKLEEARKITIEEVSSLLEGKAAGYLSGITQGKYGKIRLGENFSVSLYSNEKQNWIDPLSSPTEVSSGLIDQLYFAARLALVEIIASKVNPPIFMDDPFIHFDSDRRDKALNLITKFAEKFQVLIFTCHDYPLPPSINVVKLRPLVPNP